MVRLKYIVAYQIRSLDATCTTSHHPSLLPNTDNRTGDSTDVVIWSFLEDYTAVICASLITIRPLLAKYMPSVFRSTLGSQNHTTYTTPYPHRVDSISAGALRGCSRGSAIELKLAEGWKGVDEWGARTRGGALVESSVLICPASPLPCLMV